MRPPPAAAVAPARADLAAALARLPALAVAVIGDFCVDAYWTIDTGGDERSIETGLPVRRVRDQRYSPGGAANVVANLVDLGVGSVRAIGIVGTDPFGPVLRRLLDERGARTDGSLVSDPHWQTPVYAKRIVAGEERPRLDFGSCNELPGGAAGALLAAVEAATGDCRVIIVNQQLPRGVATPALIADLNHLISRHPDTLFLVDSRHRPDAFAGAALKLNYAEACRYAGAAPRAAGADEHAAQLALDIARRVGRPAFITRGEGGISASDGAATFHVPGLQVAGAIDAVGAGDTVVAAIAAMLGSGLPVPFAAGVANFAASVTIRKLHTTGTATPAEILAAAAEPDYIHAPDAASLAIAPRFCSGTAIEIIGELPAGIDLRACVFDHDGTLSTLRSGWEQVMEAMMLEAIFAGRQDRIDAGTLAATRDDVRRFIDQSTGLPTIAQMRWLVGRVRAAAYMEAAAIPDAAAFKNLFAARLAGLVAPRRDQVRSGTLPPAAFEVRDAAAFLSGLRRLGVALHLVSGTDHDDVVAEARLLGTAGAFGNQIHGARDGEPGEAKNAVLDRLLGAGGLARNQIAVFGDGPVEIAAARRRGIIAIGVASDERAGGIDAAKRRRLVRAGANLVIADYQEWERLLEELRCH